MVIFFFSLGFLSLLGQIVVLRELVSGLGGDEIFYAAGLGFWLLFAGLGSLLAKKMPRFKKSIVWAFQLVFVFLLPITLILFRLSLTKILSLGEVPSIFTSLLISAVAVFPLSVLSGLQFSLGCRFFKKANLAYLIETLGFVAGGLVFTFLLSGTGFPLPRKIDNQTLRGRYPHLEKIVYSRGSQLIVVRESDQETIFSSGEPIFNSEEKFASKQLSKLFSTIVDGQTKIVSFGDQNLANEITSSLSPLESIYIFSERKIFDLQKGYLDYRIRPIIVDPRQYFSTEKSAPNLVIFSPGRPASLLTNRYYTIEFFNQIRERLADNGVFVLIFSLPIDYQSEEAARLGGVIYRSLKRSFPEIEVLIAQERIVILASNKKIDFARAMEDDYFRLVWQDQRRQLVRSKFSQGREINSDSWPRAYFYHHLFWQTVFNFQLPKIIREGSRLLPLLLILLFYFWGKRLTKEKKWPLIVSLSAFILMTVETLIIFLFQTKVGYLYTRLSLIIAAVLLGMAIGVWRGEMVRRKEKGIKAALLGYLPVFLLLLLTPYWPSSVWFLILGLISGIVAGLVYALGNSLYLKEEDHPGFIYAFDLFGAFLGAVLTATYLLPRLGLINLLGLLSLLLLLTLFLY